MISETLSVGCCALSRPLFSFSGLSARIFSFLVAFSAASPSRSLSATYCFVNCALSPEFRAFRRFLQPSELSSHFLLWPLGTRTWLDKLTNIDFWLARAYHLLLRITSSDDRRSFTCVGCPGLVDRTSVLRTNFLGSDPRL